MKWLNAINQTGLKVGKNHVVCENHFKETDYQSSTRKILKADAIPSVFVETGVSDSGFADSFLEFNKIGTRVHFQRLKVVLVLFGL